MMKLFIKLIRDIRQSIGQFIAFVLVIAVGAFFYAGLVTLSDDLSDYTKAYFEEHNLSDLNVYYERISKQAVASLSYTTIIEGRIPNQANEILLDSHYAQEHQYQVGDQIQLSVNNKNEMFIISALGENVEYAKKNEIQDHRTSGFGYVSEAALPLIAGSLNKGKALASSAGIVVSTVLLITAFGTQMAMQQVADQIEVVNTYDLKIDYTRGNSPEMLQLPEGIKSSYDLSAFPVELIQGNRNENATLVVTEKDNHLIHFFDDHGNELALQDNGVLVPKSYADKYRIAEGDTIQIKFTTPELSDKTVDMEVLQISTQYSNPSFYCTPAYLSNFGIDYSPMSLLVEAGSGTELTTVRNFFEQVQQVDMISDKNDLRQSAEYIMKQNSFIFIMFIISAVVLSFGAMYTISSINIMKEIVN